MITVYSNTISVTTDAPLFDADYQAVLNYGTTQGYTLPSAGQQTLQNQLVVDLKAGGIWSKLDTFAVFATDGDSDFALIDWKRLSDYTAVNSPTFTTNQGFKEMAQVLILTQISTPLPKVQTLLCKYNLWGCITIRGDCIKCKKRDSKRNKYFSKNQSRCINFKCCCSNGG
jgi:hypothetical protein